MITFPNAKINLGLSVLGKRPDGYHDIETVFYPVGMHDILEIIVAADGIFSFKSTGMDIPGDPAENICIKAYREMAKKFELPAVKIHLHKVIPAGAGLGGGSSDCAFTIKMLNDLFSLSLTIDQMTDWARIFGSDCAFFILNRPVFAYGKGDQFEPIQLDLSAYRIVINSPGLHVNTMEAYQWIDHHPGEKVADIRKTIALPLQEWKNNLKNVFEKPVFEKFPQTEVIKREFYEEGAVYSSMTGSGSSVYAIFT